MGTQVIDVPFLMAQLVADVADVADAADPSSSHDFGRDLLPREVANDRLHAHHDSRSCVNMVGDRPCQRDVGTVDALDAANIDLIRVLPELNLYDDDWPILRLQRQLPPAKFIFDDDTRRGSAVDSPVSSGCIVSGATVRRSTPYSKVRMADGSLIENSLMPPNVSVGRGVTLERTIVDKGCVLLAGFKAGVCPAEDSAHFDATLRGIT